MTYRSAHKSNTRLAACLAAAGFLFAATASAQTQLPPPAYGNADARQDRIEELERQLTQATAENEDLQRQLNEANREITRLRAMVGELAGVNQQLAAPPAPDAGQPTAAPQQPRSAPQQQGSLGTLPASELPGEAGPAYSRARQLLLNGEYAEAEAAFEHFLATFPNADTAADARYWFAFTLLARNNYNSAAQNFIAYLERNPQGPRAPEAQVRLGIALIGKGREENNANATRQGCMAFSSLTRRYPNAPRDVRDLATREARAANCAA